MTPASTRPWVDLSRAPVLVGRPPNGDDVGAIDAYNRAIFEAIETVAGRFAYVTDARHVDQIPNAKARAIYAASSRSIAERHEHRCAAFALVTSSALLRGAITAVLWIYRPNVPMGTFLDLEEAIEYCRKHLDST